MLLPSEYSLTCKINPPIPVFEIYIDEYEKGEMKAKQWNRYNE